MKNADKCLQQRSDKIEFLLPVKPKCVYVLSVCAADMLQISTAELAAKAEETRGQLRHLDQQVGTWQNPIKAHNDPSLILLLMWA